MTLVGIRVSCLKSFPYQRFPSKIGISVSSCSSCWSTDLRGGKSLREGPLYVLSCPTESLDGHQKTRSRPLEVRFQTSELCQKRKFARYYWNDGNVPVADAYKPSWCKFKNTSMQTVYRAKAGTTTKQCLHFSHWLFQGIKHKKGRNCDLLTV